MAGSNRQDLPGELWVVATPIGNLEDLTPRARRALESADRILCEDTRRTRGLLSACQIQGKRLERWDAHVAPRRVEEALEWLKQGERLALVSDAGTPAVSDPGAELVSRAHSEGIRVVPLVGVSAMTALISVCGFEDTEFTFLGFFPRKNAEREKLWSALLGFSQAVARTAVFFESPERIARALEWIAGRSPEAELVVGKELTKIHERFFRGGAVTAAQAVAEEIEREGNLGEWVFAVRLPVAAETSEDPLRNEAWLNALRAMLDAKVALGEASRRISQHFGVSRQRVYDQGLRLTGKK